MSSCGIACWIRWPRPSCDPACSANTAPITATATAIFAPLKTPGSAAGASASRNARRRGTPSAAISLPWSGSMRSSASSVVTTIGKNETSAMITSFGARSNPSQTTSSAAITGIGTVWEATSSG